jgi:hypothetical protein
MNTNPINSHRPSSGRQSLSKITPISSGNYNLNFCLIHFYLLDLDEISPA